MQLLMQLVHSEDGRDDSILLSSVRRTICLMLGKLNGKLTMHENGKTVEYSALKAYTYRGMYIWLKAVTYFSAFNFNLYTKRNYDNSSSSSIHQYHINIDIQSNNRYFNYTVVYSRSRA